MRTSSRQRQVPSKPHRSPTNITLPELLLQEARALNINISQACEHGLAAAVSQAKAARWLSENQEAIQAWNDYVEQHGLPLEQFRRF